MKCPNCGNEISDNQKFCSNCGKELDSNTSKKLSQEELIEETNIKNDTKTTNSQNNSTSNFYTIAKKFFKYGAILAIILFAIAFIRENLNSQTSNTTISKLENQTPEQLYNSTRYEDSIYGEKVVRGYYNQYGSFDGIGKITSITKSTFLEKDGQGRFAFEVSFKYNPTNGNGDTMLDRESSMSVYAIYIVNPDDPYGTYTGISSVHYKRFGTWEEIKQDEDLCYGAWGSPLTVKYN